jgi:hypothetical protein
LTQNATVTTLPVVRIPAPNVAVSSVSAIAIAGVPDWYCGANIGTGRSSAPMAAAARRNRFCVGSAPVVTCTVSVSGG